MKLVNEGSIVATITNVLFLRTTVFLLVMHRGTVIDQQRIQRGVGFYQDFVGMTTQDLRDWKEDDQTFSAFPEQRELYNSYDEEKEVDFNAIRHAHSAVQVQRS